jgi:hypothetical protein
MSAHYYFLLGIILIGLAVYHYKTGSVRSWAGSREWTRADQPVIFWAILVGEIISGIYLFIMALS